MIRLELIEVTEQDIKYKYYPEDSEEYGIVVLRKISKERDIKKNVSGYSSNYVAHAFRRLEEYCEKNTFPEKDIVAWY